MALSCDLYTSNWLGTNFFVILLMLFIVALVYLISRTLPTQTKARLTGLVRSEITQLFISVFIIVALLATSGAACTAAGYMAQQVQSAPVQQHFTTNIPFPALPPPSISSAADPFQYSEQYVGAYAFDLGPNLAAQNYAASYSFSILSGFWDEVGTIIGEVIPTLNGNVGAGGVSFGWEIPIGAQLGVPYGILSDDLIGAFAPLVLIGIGIMLFQYVILVIAAAVAFSVILPVALVIRSLSFTSGTLKSAANALIAIAIGLYIIYPVMIVFNSYGLSWIFTPCVSSFGACNPSAQFLQQTYMTQKITQPSFPPIKCISQPAGICIPFITPQFFLQNVYNFWTGALTFFNYNLSGATADVQYLALSTAEYLFTVVVLFAINIAVVVGFAMGLTKALNNGIEGAATFWSGI